MFYTVKEHVRQCVLDMHVDNQNGFEHGSMVNIGQYSKYSSFTPQEFFSAYVSLNQLQNDTSSVVSLGFPIQDKAQFVFVPWPVAGNFFFKTTVEHKDIKSMWEYWLGTWHVIVDSTFKRPGKKEVG